MYHEVHRLLREGVSYSAIASLFVMNRRTVVKYAGMTEAEYEAFLIKKDTRTKLLDVYEAFVRDRLMAHPAASAAQMHDWLKERTDIAYDDQLTRPVIITNFDHLSGPGPSADIDGGLVIAVLPGQMCGEVLSTPVGNMPFLLSAGATGGCLAGCIVSGFHHGNSRDFCRGCSSKIISQ